MRWAVLIGALLWPALGWAQSSGPPFFASYGTPGTLVNKTLVNPLLVNPTISGTLTLPAAQALAGRNTVTLLNSPCLSLSVLWIPVRVSGHLEQFYIPACR